MNKKIKIIKLYYIMVTIVASLIFSIMPVYAAEDPLAVINNLSNFVFSILRGVGTILLAFGISQFGMSFKSHDPSQRANGVMTIVGGIIIAFSKEILNIIMGG